MSKIDEIRERNTDAQRRRLGVNYLDALQAHMRDIPYLLSEYDRLNDFEHSQCAKLLEEVGRLRAELEQATITLDRIKRDLNEPDKVYIHVSDYFGWHSPEKE